MQGLAYSIYCSLKYLSGQGYLFQESQQSGWNRILLLRGRLVVRSRLVVG